MVINSTLKGGAINCPIVAGLNKPLHLGGIIGKNNDIIILAKKFKSTLPAKAWDVDGLMDVVV